MNFLKNLILKRINSVVFGWLARKLNRLFLGVCIAIGVCTGNTAAHIIVSKRFFLSCKINKLRNKFHSTDLIICTYVRNAWFVNGTLSVYACEYR